MAKYVSLGIVVVYFDVDIVYRWRTCFRVVGVLTFLSDSEVGGLFDLLSARIIGALRPLQTISVLLAEIAILVFNHMTLWPRCQHRHHLSVVVVRYDFRYRRSYSFDSLRVGCHRIFCEHFL